MRTLSTLLFGTIFTLPLLAIGCDDGPGSSAGVGGDTGSAGSGTAGKGQAGSGTAGTGTAGSGTAGSGTAGSGTAGSGTAGSGTAGSGAAGSGTAGSGTAGFGQAGSGTAGFGQAGSGTAGFGQAGSGSGDLCKPGASQPAPDGCNTCVCDAKGDWVCSATPCISECNDPQPPCAPPPPGCDYVGGGCVASQWTCGELVCGTECKQDSECPAIKIACHQCPGGGVSCPQSACVGNACDIVWSTCTGVAPGLACEKPGLVQPADDGCNTCSCGDTLTWSCTEKACTTCDGPIPSCAAPPDGCSYLGGGCVDGQWTCGTLSCPEACLADSDCPQVKIACQACPGGGFSCPQSACVDAACTLLWSACTGVAPGLACDKPGLQQPADDGCNTCTCGDTLTWGCTKKACLTCEGPLPPCAPPPPGCDYKGSGCVDGQWTCGTLVCPMACKADSDCPVSDAPCKQCSDGSDSCPDAACVDGACVMTWPMCP